MFSTGILSRHYDCFNCRVDHLHQQHWHLKYYKYARPNKNAKQISHQPIFPWTEINTRKELWSQQIGLILQLEPRPSSFCIFFGKSWFVPHRQQGWSAVSFLFIPVFWVEERPGSMGCPSAAVTALLLVHWNYRHCQCSPKHLSPRAEKQQHLSCAVGILWQNWSPNFWCARHGSGRRKQGWDCQPTDTISRCKSTPCPTAASSDPSKWHPWSSEGCWWQPSLHCHPQRGCRGWAVQPVLIGAQTTADLLQFPPGSGAAGQAADFSWIFLYR